MHAIHTTNLTKRYRDTVAVSKLSLRIEPGEVYGIVGPNGAGKSTTIGLLLGFVRPTAGSARVLGYDVGSARQQVGHRVGILPDRCGLYPRLTGRELLDFVIDTHGATDSASTLLDRVGLGEDGDRRLGTYSSGMAQRFRIACSLVDSPDLLVLDEPVRGLDPSGRRLLGRLLATERDRGAAVFLSSHELARVRDWCDRVGFLVEGVLQEEIDVAVAAESSPRLRLTVDADREAIAHAVTERSDVTAVETDEAGLVVRLQDPGRAQAVLRTARGVGSVSRFDLQTDAVAATYDRLTEDRL